MSDVTYLKGRELDPLFMIALVMSVSGLLGGLVNYFLSDPKDENPLTWWKHLFVGVAAAYMVPLFLNMISGDLIDKIRGLDGKPSDFSKLFVLAGFCLVAAVSSRAFIRTLSDRILQEARSANKAAAEAKEEAAEAKAFVAPLIEDDTPDALAVLIAPEQPSINATELLVLKVMINGAFSMRSITGIAKDSELDRATVNNVLSALIGKGLVQQTMGSNGHPRWFPTPEGRKRALLKE